MLLFFLNKKKTLGDIVILHLYTKNLDMIYSSWDIIVGTPLPLIIGLGCVWGRLGRVGPSTNWATWGGGGTKILLEMGITLKMGVGQGIS